MIGMIKLSLAGLREKKGRTALIALSIAIGVFSVLIISIISDNGVTLINSELDTLGICGVSISKTSAEPAEMLTNEDLESIKKEYYVESATPLITTTGYLKNDDISSALICGIDENAKSVISVETVLGSKIDRSDIVAKAAVCQIDEETAKTLFGNRSPLGKTIDIFIGGSTVRFTVTGIVKASSSILQTSVGDLLPSIIYIPYTTLQNLMGTGKINQIAVNFSGEYSNEECVERIKSVINSNSIYSAELKVEDLNKQRDSLSGLLSIITTVLRLIGGVSLIVSGLGIMTIMLVSVNEKTKEIGIKKSIGASKRDIAFEFIFESAFISVLGGIIGTALTLIAALSANIFLKIAIDISPVTVISAVGAAVLCGVLFGVYPALKAAKLKPIDALRSE